MPHRHRSMNESKFWRRPVSRRMAVGAGFVAASTVTGAWWWRGSGSPTTIGPLDNQRAAAGERAPRFVLEEVRTGRSVSLPAHGMPALLSFSATWCLTCVAELRNLQIVQGTFRGKATIAVVDFQQTRDSVLNLIDRLNVPDLTVLLDSDGSVTRAYRVNSLPAMALIDAKGVVRELGNVFLSPEVIVERLGRVVRTPG